MPRARGAVRRRARTGAVLLTAVLASTLLGPTASATPSRPPAPTAAQVRDAKAAAATAAVALRSAQAQVDAADAQLAVLGDRVEALVEAWNAARAASEQAAADLTAARGRADAAAIAATSAQGDVDRLAAASYQVGADLSGGLGEWASVVDSVFRSDGVVGLTERVSAVRQVAAGRRQEVQDATALRFAALQARLAAEAAASALAASESAAEAAAQAVQQAQQAQRAEVTRLTAQRATAAAVLTTARRHATALDRARQAELARIAAEKRAAAARTAAAARAAAVARAAAEAARQARERQAPGGRPPTDAGGPQQWPDGQPVATDSQRRTAVAFAEAQLGKPYVAGGRGPDNYDCSGLTSAAYISAGVPMIAYSQTQFASYPKVPVGQLQPGDLVFFAFDPNDWTTIHHVGIYVGGGRMVEAPHTGAFVRYRNIWMPDLVAFGVRP